jgi:hypothetical protein
MAVLPARNVCRAHNVAALAKLGSNSTPISIGFQAPIGEEFAP